MLRYSFYPRDDLKCVLRLLDRDRLHVFFTRLSNDFEHPFKWVRTEMFITNMTSYLFINAS